MKMFIDQKKILEIIDNTKFSQSSFERIIARAFSLKGLNPDEAAMLLSCDRREHLNQLFAAAGRLKELIYGRRIVFFAPLYISSFCTNNCFYCGFRNGNNKIRRKRLSIDEIKQEVKALELQGHKRLLVVAGEDREIDADYLVSVIRTIYATKKNRGQIRRLNINVAPLDLCGFRKLKQAGIGTYQLFQETYHRDTYRIMHPSGPKSNFEARLCALNLAQEAGINDVGIGALFGLYDYRFEVLGLIAHSQYLEDEFGVGPHTISIPRIEPASDSQISDHPPYRVSDLDLKKITAVLRLAVPYAGLILSTREDPGLRNELLYLGISQVSAGSRTNPGGYSKDGDGQFCLGDHRTLKQVVCDTAENGFIPSFCTACYRNQRTGRDFMRLAKPGSIQKFCLPNALLTLKEFNLDYNNSNGGKLNALIDEQALNIEDSRIKKATREKLERIEQGERDLYF